MSTGRRHRSAWVIGESSSSAASRLLKIQRENEESERYENYEFDGRRKHLSGDAEPSTRSLNTVSTVASVMSRQGRSRETNARFARSWSGLVNPKKQKKSRRPSLSGGETVYTAEDSFSAGSRGGEDNSRRRLRDLAEGAVISSRDCDMVDNELVTMRLKASSFRLKGNREERSGAAPPTTFGEPANEPNPRPAAQLIPEDEDDLEEVMSMAWRQPNRVTSDEKIDETPTAPTTEEAMDEDEDDDCSETMQRPVIIDEEDEDDDASSDSMEAPVGSPVEGNVDNATNVYMTEALRHMLTAYAMQQTASSVDFLSSSLQAPLPPVVFADSRNNSSRSVRSTSGDLLRAD